MGGLRRLLGVRQTADAPLDTRCVCRFHFRHGWPSYIQWSVLCVAMFEQLKRAVRRQTRGASFQECRRCGTTVEQVGGDCPSCESTEIARYELWVDRTAELAAAPSSHWRRLL